MLLKLKWATSLPFDRLGDLVRFLTVQPLYSSAKTGNSSLDFDPLALVARLQQ